MSDSLSDQVIEGGSDILEFTTDQLLDDGLLKDFPEGLLSSWLVSASQ